MRVVRVIRLAIFNNKLTNNEKKIILTKYIGLRSSVTKKNNQTIGKMQLIRKRYEFEQLL